MIQKHKKNKKKLLPWLNKAKANKTNSSKILHELKKVKLLNVKEESFIIKYGDEWDTELLNKRIARFSVLNNIEAQQETVIKINNDN